jgi:hypothetical protein
VSDVDIAEHQIKWWLSRCDGEHSNCRTSSRETLPSLPTRLVEILGPKKVRLYVPGTLEANGQYVCLSHCWGKAVPIRTTSKTLQKFQHSGIPWEDLPKTFQHAITMTRRLGLTFIWIDTLCIIQDNLADWRHEGSRMAEIYSKSYITLAATYATQSTGGLYNNDFQRTEPLTHTTRSIYDRYEPLDLLVYEEFPVSSKGFINDDLSLLKRAWAFQERLLSPRIVHFADDMLYWECLGHSWSELDSRTVGLNANEAVSRHQSQALVCIGRKFSVKGQLTTENTTPNNAQIALV